MLHVSKTSISFIGSLRQLQAVLTDAVRRNPPGMTLLEYCRERREGR
jgi:hypothetical protein